MENGYYLCKVITDSTKNIIHVEPKLLYWEDNLWLTNPKGFKTIKNDNVLLHMKIPDEFFHI